MSIVFASIISFVIAVCLGPVVIPVLRKLKFGQTEREEGPESHQIKSGTPTMGGFIFIIPITIVTFLIGGFYIDTVLPVLALLLFGSIGFIDDYIKVVKKRNLGLRAYQKIILQFTFAMVVSLLEVKYSSLGTSVYIPFSNKLWDMGCLYIPFLVILLIGVSNSVNLTDGLDGLCTSVTILVMLFFGVLSNCMHSMRLVSFNVAVLGSCLGFLLYNKYPAKVFMGDTGSMALGGAVAISAIMLHTALILPFVGIIYMLEALSVIVQVVSFKTTGKRVFRMSPLHHHFELGGWSEVKVTIVFTTITFIFCIIGWYGLAGVCF